MSDQPILTRQQVEIYQGTYVDGTVIHSLASDLLRLMDVVDRLPTTADGVPVVPGMPAYQWDNSFCKGDELNAHCFVHEDSGDFFGQDVGSYWSTPKLAEAAALAAKGAADEA